MTISLTRINVPAHVRVAADATLVCQFDLEGESLYSVKWYKDDAEFYRYVPNERPRLQVFHQKGIHVDVSRTVGFENDNGTMENCERKSDAAFAAIQNSRCAAPKFQSYFRLRLATFV